MSSMHSGRPPRAARWTQPGTQKLHGFASTRRFPNRRQSAALVLGKRLIRLVEFARSGAAVPIRHFGPAMEDAADERGAELAIAAAREARGNAGRKGNGAADQRRAGEMGGARPAPAKDDRSLSADEADDDDDKRIERRRPAPQNQRDQRRDRRNREDERDPDWRPRIDKCRTCRTRGGDDCRD